MTRELPQSLEAERAVLGQLLLSPADVTLGLAEQLAAGDFYRGAHQELYRVISAMAEAGEVVETVSVVDRLHREGRAEACGGLAYVSALADGVPSTENLPYYVAIVRDRAIRRRLYLALLDVQSRILAGAEELPALLGAAESAVQSVQEGDAATGELRSIGVIAEDAYQRVKAAAERASAITGVTTGYLDLDRMMTGLQPSDLVILAARPAMGKSALAMAVAQHAAESGVGVAVFSLEMSSDQVGARVLSGTASVQLSRIRTGQLSRDREWPALGEALGRLGELPLYVCDQPALTVGQIRGKVRRLKARDPGLRLVVVDYLQLLGADQRLPREQQVSAMSRGLKALAKELDVAVLALSQLNRGVEQRQDKRPLLSDLRESGAIEQDADVILFIYRDEYYNKETRDRNIAEVIIAKQRNGPTGTVKLFFDGAYTRFDNLAAETWGAP